MKASVLVSLATAFLAAAPAAAQSIVFSSFADTKDDSQCSGSLGSVSVVTDIMDLMDDNGQYASPCISTSGSMSCLDTDPSDLTNDNECSVNIFSDNACATTVGNIPVHQVTTAEHKVDNGKWQSLNIECDLYNITSSEAFKAAVKTGKERWVSRHSHYPLSRCPSALVNSRSYAIGCRSSGHVRLNESY